MFGGGGTTERIIPRGGNHPQGRVYGEKSRYLHEGLRVRQKLSYIRGFSEDAVAGWDEGILFRENEDRLLIPVVTY